MNASIQITICSGNALVRHNLAAALADLGRVAQVASPDELAARLQIAGSGVVLIDGSGLKSAAALRRLAVLARSFGQVRLVVFHIWPDRNLLQQLLAAGVWGALSYTAPLDDFRDGILAMKDNRKYFSSDIPLLLLK